MDDESEKNNDLEVKGLRLIDVSSEDDCLLDSSSWELLDFNSSENQHELRNFELLEAMDANKVEDATGTLEEGEAVPQPLESLEPEGPRKNGKCNLRTSLAWDSAFFTSAGVLDPDELSSMIWGVEKGEKHELPAIQEDIGRSTESFSTLESDSLTLESSEAVLFEDIRASIQRSCKLSKVANASSKAGSGVKALKKVDFASQNKMKSRPSVKKPSVDTEGSGKTTKQVSVCPSVSQMKCVASRWDPISLLPKPPKVLGRASSISTTSTKRASLGTNHVRMEKDIAKRTTDTGRGALVSKVPASGACITLPKSRPHSRSPSSGSSTVNKTEPTTSRSSFDSSGSTTSDNIGLAPFNSIKRKINSGTVNSSSGATIKTPSRVALRYVSQSGHSHLSPSTKLTSSISPASSISEWSSESSSPTSTVNQRSISSRVSLETSSCKRVSEGSEAPQILGFQTHSNDHCSVGHETQVTGLLNQSVKRVSVGSGALVRPASVKPSGLRMPSPKIGFFDGMVCTPDGSMQIHPGAPSGLPSVGLGKVSPSGGSNKAMRGKLQPARNVTVIRNTKADAQKTDLTIKPKFPIPLKEPANASMKVSSASIDVSSCPGMPPKFQNKKSPKSGGESHLKATGGVKGCDLAIHDPDSGLMAEKIGSLDILMNKVSPKIKGSSPGKDSKVPYISGEERNTTCDSSSMHFVENIIPSQNVVEDAIDGQHSFSSGNAKEKGLFEDQVDGLCRHVEAVDINAKIHKELIGDSLALSWHNVSCHDSSAAPY